MLKNNIKRNITSLALMMLAYLFSGGIAMAQTNFCGFGQIVKLDTPSSITINGNNIDSVWSSVQSNNIGNLTVGTKPANLAANWKAMWDSNYLYVLVEVQDSFIRPYPGSGLDYNYDAVEIFISGNDNQGTTYGANDFQYVFDYGTGVNHTTGVFAGPNNGGTNNTNVTGVAYAIDSTATGYAMEIKIPWSNIGISPVLGNNIGLDVAVDDNDNNSGTRDAQIEWNATSTQAFSNPSLFGLTPLVDCISQITGIPNPAPPQQVLASIYTAYDSLPNLSFDAQYIYTQDTAQSSPPISNVLQGSYTMAGRKSLYNIGDIQFMQNDSFFIAVYNDQKFIMVANPRVNNVGSNLPLRPLMDSIVQSYSTHYTITDTLFNNGSGEINFTRADSFAQFDRFTIAYYNIGAPLLSSIFYSFKDPIWPTDSIGAEQDSMPITYHRKTFKVEFSNYKFDNFSPSLYDENNYIWFENGVCVPVDKYKGYQIYYSRSQGNIGGQSQ
jgi:cellulose/xylan binding protein with CBM9 domain